MALVAYTVDELSTDLKINEDVIAYAEDQNGPARNTRYGRRYNRVRLGLQVSPENFFYDAGQWAGAAYVNLKALEFTMSTGTAYAGVYSGFAGDELFAVEDTDSGMKLALKVNAALLEQIEVREGDDYLATGNPVQQIHLSLKSSNKPDITFYEWHPQSKYKFNRECNVITDTLTPDNAVAYMGDNNYVLSPALFQSTLAAVNAMVIV
jgi:hypothetical protein